MKLAASEVAIVLVLLRIGTDAECPKFSHQQDSHCVCDIGLVCHHDGSPLRRGCSIAKDYTHLSLKSGFSLTCESCSCKSPLIKLTTLSKDQCGSEFNTDRLNDWTVAVANSNGSDIPCRDITTFLDASYPFNRWARRALAQLPPSQRMHQMDESAADSPWAALCTPALATEQAIEAPTFRMVEGNDHRIALWMHSKLLSSSHRDYLLEAFNQSTVERMTLYRHYVTVIYVHELHSNGPAILLQPHAYTPYVCSQLDSAIVGHGSLADSHVEHLMQLMPQVVAHVHFKTMQGFMDMMQGRPVPQVPRTPESTGLSAMCRRGWPHDHANVFPGDHLHITLSAALPAYPGHWEFLSGAIDKLSEGTEQPDQVIIGSSQLSLKQGRDMLYAMPGINGYDRVVVSGILGPSLASGNRNVGMMMARMKLIMTMDGDDVTHPQRTEFVRWFYHNRPFSLLLHAGQQSKPPEVQAFKAWCMSGPEVLDGIVHDAWDLITANDTHPPKGDVRFPLGSGMKFGYAAHMTTALDSRLFTVEQSPPVKIGEDSAFDRALIAAGHKGGHAKSYLVRWQLVFYIKSRSKIYEQQRLGG
eukprot:TRINITY_DN10581_c0_g1_i2.p1 TRINITY_DN10581_c0_g1~~TRINITY_DN10581_c0_g1_i2.p1  ORF type:complete len:585 (+),score=103.38 TRINITY_DN10581_c0_g1_i2:880-2634(+)